MQNYVNINFNSLNVNGSKIPQNINCDFIWINGTMCEFLSSLYLALFPLLKNEHALILSFKSARKYKLVFVTINLQSKEKAVT